MKADRSKQRSTLARALIVGLLLMAAIYVLPLLWGLLCVVYNIVQTSFWPEPRPVFSDKYFWSRVGYEWAAPLYIYDELGNSCLADGPLNVLLVIAAPPGVLDRNDGSSIVVQASHVSLRAFDSDDSSRRITFSVEPNTVYVVSPDLRLRTERLQAGAAEMVKRKASDAQTRGRRLANVLGLIRTLAVDDIQQGREGDSDQM